MFFFGINFLPANFRLRAGFTLSIYSSKRSLQSSPKRAASMGHSRFPGTYFAWTVRRPPRNCSNASHTEMLTLRFSASSASSFSLKATSSSPSSSEKSSSEVVRGVGIPLPLLRFILPRLPLVACLSALFKLLTDAPSTGAHCLNQENGEGRVDAAFTLLREHPVTLFAPGELWAPPAGGALGNWDASRASRISL
jgi:hypothetical protein